MATGLDGLLPLQATARRPRFEASAELADAIASRGRPYDRGCVETLSERIARDGPLNELDAVGWVVRLARRIEVMHALGVAHGNITPGCFATESADRNGPAALVDVRRARPAVGYQSPERIRGGVASIRDDIWGLGATLYAALTGGAPFSGGSEDEVRHKILTHRPAPLAVFDVGNDELQRIIDSVLARDAGERPATVAALREDLERWHPDPLARRLPPVDDADDPEIFDDDTSDMGGATVLRPPVFDDEDARTLPRQRAVRSVSASRTSAEAVGAGEDRVDPLRTSAELGVPSVEQRAAARAASAATPAMAAAAPPDGEGEEVSTWILAARKERTPDPSARPEAPHGSRSRPRDDSEEYIRTEPRVLARLSPDRLDTLAAVTTDAPRVEPLPAPVKAPSEAAAPTRDAGVADVPANERPAVEPRAAPPPGTPAQASTTASPPEPEPAGTPQDLLPAPVADARRLRPSLRFAIIVVVTLVVAAGATFLVLYTRARHGTAPTREPT